MSFLPYQVPLKKINALGIGILKSRSQWESQMQSIGMTCCNCNFLILYFQGFVDALIWLLLLVLFYILAFSIRLCPLLSQLVCYVFYWLYKILSRNLHKIVNTYINSFAIPRIATTIKLRRWLNPLCFHSMFVSGIKNHTIIVLNSYRRLSLDQNPLNNIILLMLNDI